jgi:hypothetical protein
MLILSIGMSLWKQTCMTFCCHILRNICLSVINILPQLSFNLIELSYWYWEDTPSWLFFTQVCSGSKFCPSVLETVGLGVPPRRTGDFALFSVCPSCKDCPSARCASAANAVCRDDHLFVSRNILLRRLLQDSWLYIIVLLLLHVYFSHFHLYVSNIIIIIFC